MTQKHTPGPWYVDATNHMTGEVDGARFKDVIAYDHRAGTNSQSDEPLPAVVAQVSDYDGFKSDAEIEATAQLIAAAPQMYHALKVIEETLRSGAPVTAEVRAKVTNALKVAGGLTLV
ncbi:MAG: hypothetical protein AAFY06_00165 [Pseudomonadota bacterium]